MENIPLKMLGQKSEDCFRYIQNSLYTEEAINAVNNSLKLYSNRTNIKLDAKVRTISEEVLRLPQFTNSRNVCNGLIFHQVNDVK